MIHFRVRYERLRDKLGQVRRRAALLRAAWLALVVPLVGLTLHMLGYTDIRPVVWLAIAAAVFVVAALWQMRRRTERELGRELDRRYELNDLMITAVEVDQRGPRGSVEGRLLDDAATAVATLGDERAIDGRASRREGETAVALGLVVIGLWLLAGTFGQPAGVDRLPDLIGHGGIGEGPGPGTGPGDGQGSGGQSAGMGALAGALGDHAAARGIADALARGDAAEAARAARALAEQSSALSPAGRADLAKLLAQAADDMAPADPDLARAVRQASRSLESPDPEALSAGVDQLAAQLDVVAAQQLAGPGAPDSDEHSRMGPLTKRLSAESKPALLQASPPPPGSASALTAGDRAAIGIEPESSRVSGGSPRSGGQSIGADPLAYPWSLRMTVRRYFAPEDHPR